MAVGTGTTLNILHAAIREHRNILIVGSSSSGKTDLCTALLADVAVLTPDDPVFIIDSPSLRTIDPRFVRVYVTPSRSLTECFLEVRRRVRYEAPTLLMSTSSKAKAALGPRLILDEIRGSESAMALLTDWGDSLGGIATIHASRALNGLRRLDSFIKGSEAAKGLNVGKWIASRDLVIVDLMERKFQQPATVGNCLQVVDHNESGYEVRWLGWEAVERTGITSLDSLGLAGRTGYRLCLD
jgi:Flp pilus assembly CpaF family ATPase